MRCPSLGNSASFHKTKSATESASSDSISIPSVRSKVLIGIEPLLNSEPSSNLVHRDCYSLNSSRMSPAEKRSRVNSYY